jgi:hypothetical protein
MAELDVAYSERLLDRMLSKIDFTDGCWVWIGGRFNTGYGRISVRDYPHLAHRVMYETVVGPIPEGLHIDHLCRNRACVNPDHLEPVTQAENNQRAWDAAPRERCKRGHLLDDDSYITKAGYRDCRACRRFRRSRTI